MDKKTRKENLNAIASQGARHHNNKQAADLYQAEADKLAASLADLREKIATRREAEAENVRELCRLYLAAGLSDFEHVKIPPRAASATCIMVLRTVVSLGGVAEGHEIIANTPIPYSNNTIYNALRALIRCGLLSIEPRATAKIHTIAPEVIAGMISEADEALYRLDALPEDTLEGFDLAALDAELAAFDETEATEAAQ